MKHNDKITLAEIPLNPSTDLERQVVYDAIQTPSEVGTLTAQINETMFTDDALRTIWNTLVKMYETGQPIDATSVAQRCGVEMFIQNIMAHKIVPSGLVAVEEHAILLRAAAARRRLYYSCLEVLQKAVRPEVTEEDVYLAAEAFATQVQQGFDIKGEKNLGQILNDVADDIQHRLEVERSGGHYYCPSGFHMLDPTVDGGWAPGQLILLAARPGVGKTAFMLQMAKAAAEAKFPVQVFSLEMTDIDLGYRMLYSTNRTTPKELRRGIPDWDVFEQAVGGLQDLPIFVDDFSRNLKDILARMAVAVKRGRCKVAFIDYLGYIRGKEDKNSNLAQRIGEITAELKAAAKRLGIPIVLLCQLNRDSIRGNRPPELYDLRDSGAIEQDADIALMLQRMDEDRVDMWVRKNRRGRINFRIELQTNNTYTAFDCLRLVREDYTAEDVETETDNNPL